MGFPPVVLIIRNCISTDKTSSSAKCTTDADSGRSIESHAVSRISPFPPALLLFTMAADFGCGLIGAARVAAVPGGYCRDCDPGDLCILPR